jgi:hypothetical protein
MNEGHNSSFGQSETEASNGIDGLQHEESHELSKFADEWCVTLAYRSDAFTGGAVSDERTTAIAMQAKT